MDGEGYKLRNIRFGNQKSFDMEKEVAIENYCASESLDFDNTLDVHKAGCLDLN